MDSQARGGRTSPGTSFVRELVTARGSTLENGAANFFAMHEDPQDMAETVSMAFLGMSINCARCHDHPLEKWTNDDYYGMANLFARVRGKGWGGEINSGDGDRIIFVADSGELIQPRTGHPQPPRPLDGKPVAFESSDRSPRALADWLTDPKNPVLQPGRSPIACGPISSARARRGGRRHAADQPGQQSRRS